MVVSGNQFTDGLEVNGLFDEVWGSLRPKRCSHAATDRLAGDVSW